MIIIEDVMTPKPLTLSAFASLADARRLMETNRFRHVPIVDEQGKLVGIVSQRNVLAHSLVDAAKVGEDELRDNETGILLADIMVTEPVTVSPKATVRSAAQQLFDHKIGCLPVVDDQGLLLGIITDSDFVAITIQLLELAEHSEPV